MKTVDPKTERAVRTFLERTSPRYPVIGARLFGSRSRAGHNPGSDADLVVFLRGSRGNAIDVGVDMAGVAFDVPMDTEILVSPLPIWGEEWARPEGNSNPRLLGISDETESFFEGRGFWRKAKGIAGGAHDRSLALTGPQTDCIAVLGNHDSTLSRIAIEAKLSINARKCLVDCGRHTST